MNLPRFNTLIKEFSLMQDKWKSILDPLISNPSNQASILQNIALVSGNNVINHGLGQILQGWRLIRINAGVTIYDAQASNKTPELTLILHSSSTATISLEVF